MGTRNVSEKPDDLRAATRAADPIASRSDSAIGRREWDASPDAA